MQITNAKYVSGLFENEKNIFATIEGVECYIPIDPANAHYAEIMRQVEAGELTIADAE